MDNSMIFSLLSSVTETSRYLSQRLPSATTVAQLRTIWIDAFPVSSPNLEIRSKTDGHILDDDLCLADLPRVAPGADIVQLEVLEPSALLFRLSPGSSQPQELSLLLSMHPSGLLPLLFDLFNLPENRKVRLLSRSGTHLQQDRSLIDQGVVPGDTLTLEVEFRIQRRSQWQGEALEEIYCFASDNVGDTLTSDIDGECQLQFASRTLSLTSTIGEALQLSSEDQVEHCVAVASQRFIFVLGAEGIRRVEVSPDTTISSLGIAPSMVICDESLLPSSQAIPASETMNACLLVNDVITVTVEFGKRSRSVQRISSRATVGDLWRQVVAGHQRSQETALFFQGQRLTNSEASLSSVGIGNQALVQARIQQPLQVSLKTLNGCNTVLVAKPGVHSMTYDELRAFHDREERRLKQRCCPREGLEFRCDGCRWRIISGELGHQFVPSRCCKQKSLSLTAIAVKDKSVQTHLEKRSESVETQTTLKTEDKQTATRFFSEVHFDIADAQDNTVKELSVQCSIEDEKLPDSQKKLPGLQLARTISNFMGQVTRIKSNRVKREYEALTSYI